MTDIKRNKRFFIDLLTIVFCCSMAPRAQAADVTAAPKPVIQQNFQDSQLINASFADTGRHILLLHENVIGNGLTNEHIPFFSGKHNMLVLATDGNVLYFN